MSKHPGPWTITDSGYMLDANGTGIAHVYTDDPETRAVLLHAAEMFETLRSVADLYRQCAILYHDLHDCNQPGGDPLNDLQAVLSKIESEIDTSRKP